VDASAPVLEWALSLALLLALPSNGF
jgi:hypothetical protein